MNSEKMRLLLEIAQSNPNLEIDKLIQLVSFEKTEAEPVKEEVDIKEVEGVKKKIGIRKTWTIDDDNTLIYMRKRGRTQKDIAKQLNRNAGSVAARVSFLLNNGVLQEKVERKPYERTEIELIESLLTKFGEVDKIPKDEIKQLSDLLDRTEKAIATKLYHLKSGGYRK